MELRKTVLHSILHRAPDDKRLDSFETCRADKNCGIKVDYKNCASRWLLTHITERLFQNAVLQA